MIVQSRQRWLVIAHAFNMDGRAASQTITDKLPHLKKAGIEVVILSGVSGRKDTEFEHHQLWPMGPAGFRFELRHVLSRRFGKGIRYRLLMLLASVFFLPWMLLEKWFKPVESSWSWWLSAYLKGRALARQKPFDLIYSTGGAFAAHLAARSLKNATGVPWLAEVHDPLVIPGELPVSAQQKMQAEVERQICTDADVAIWFTEKALSSARKRHPQLAERGQMMLPGIDKPFDLLPPYQPSPKFVIGHFGSLSTSRHLGLVISALELLQERRPVLLDAIELHIYGGPLDPVSSEALIHSRVGRCVRYFGRIEADSLTGLSGREQILHRMRSVDVLLLLHGVDVICSEYIPSKLYEYLWMQRPILAIVHRNPQMASLISEQGHLVVSSGHEGVEQCVVKQELVSCLEQLFDRWRAVGLTDNGLAGSHTTEAAVATLLGWANQTKKVLR